MQQVKIFALLMMLVALGNLTLIEEESNLSKEDERFIQNLKNKEEEGHHLSLSEEDVRSDEIEAAEAENYNR